VPQQAEAKARLEEFAASGEPDRVIRLAAARRWPLVTGIEGAITLVTNDLRLEEDRLCSCTTSRP
jgi:hypothetical protein